MRKDREALHQVLRQLVDWTLADQADEAFVAHAGDGRHRRELVSRRPRRLLQRQRYVCWGNQYRI